MRALFEGLTVTMAFMAGVAACNGGMAGHHEGQDLSAGKLKLTTGIERARGGVAECQAGRADLGSAAVDEGRGMMGPGMVMMGLGCCVGDGRPGSMGDGGIGCAAMMGAGVPMMIEGLAKFDGARPLMMHPDAAAAGRAMSDMEAGMRMMEDGSRAMTGGHQMTGGGMM